MNLGIFGPLVSRSIFNARNSAASLQSSRRHRLPPLRHTIESQFRRPYSTNDEIASQEKKQQNVSITIDETKSDLVDHISDVDSTSNQTGLSSRKASRLARKQRRIDAGMYSNKRTRFNAGSALTENDPQDVILANDKSSEDTMSFVPEELDSRNDEYINRTTEEPAWKTRKRLVKDRLDGASWNPTRKLSPSTIEGIRALYDAYGEHIDLRALSKQFDVSFEAMRRIVKSKSWKPTEEEQENRQKRWEARGERIWTKLAEKGVKPPGRWRRLGVGDKEHGKVSEEKQLKWWADNVERLMSEEAAKEEALGKPEKIDS